MPTTIFSGRFATLLSTGLFLLAHSANAAALHPKAIPARPGSLLLPRQQPCPKASLDVSQDAIIQDTCGSNPQDNYSECSDQLTDYIQQSINPTCEHNDELHNDCLAVNQNDENLCTASLEGYEDCGNYTLQAYAYCGCLFSTPYDLFRCAGVQLEARPYLPASIIAPGAIPTSLPGQSLISFLSYEPVVTSSAIFTPLTSYDYGAIPSSLVPPGGILPSSILGSAPISSVSQLLTPTRTAALSIFPTPSSSSSGTQVTSTTLSTTVVVKTLTVTSCAATVANCPATTTTTAETQTWTVMVCDGGCTGPAPVRATGVCVRRPAKGEL